MAVVFLTVYAHALNFTVPLPPAPTAVYRESSKLNPQHPNCGSTSTLCACFFLPRQVVETYPRDFLRANAEAMGAGDEGGNAALLPLDPDSLVRKVISAKDRTIFHPAPMEDGAAGVADAKIWARVQATVRRWREPARA